MLCTVSPYHQSINISDPTFEAANASLSWAETSGPWGTIVDRYQIDQATASFRLKALFANQDDRLWPGQFVNARLLLETRSNVVVVPSTAVQRGPNGLIAWTITADNTAVTRRIEVGPTTGGLTIVTSGLSEGDRVVTDGHYKLQSNVPVSITPPPPVTASGG